ncbi:MAG TPA: PD-(D/E)XK nuclease family protein [Candidatus Polarisedimenticolaceae bacterium]|nr:PD-(D/E)XK nuclease family protein [Candidatus Polarisedimenticolaceae bacterium]
MDVLAHPDPFVLEAALLDRVAAIKAADPLARVLVLVPTRRLAEHVLRRAAARFRALLGLDVRHHRALVLELLEEAGEAPRLAPRAARQRLLERVLEGLPGNTWSTYAAGSPGATGAILEALDDLREAGIAPEALAHVPVLAEVYLAYAHALGQAAWRGVVDDAGLVEAALPHVPSHGGRFAAVLHHGAYELTGIHLDLVRALAAVCPVTFLSPFLPGAPATRYAETFARRYLLAEGDPPHVPPGSPGGALGPRLPGLWNEDAPAVDALPGAISLADVQGPEAELTYGLRRALAIVSEHGALPPSEVAVLARSLAPYRTVLEAEVPPLPLTSSLGMPLRRDPYVHDLLLVLSIVLDDFPRARTAEALRSPRLRWGVSAEAADAWSLQAGILGGLAAWCEDLPAWAGEPRRIEDASDEERAEERARAEARRSRAQEIASALTVLAQHARPDRIASFAEHARTIADVAARLLRPPAAEAAPLGEALALLDGLQTLPLLLGEDRRVSFAEAARAFERAVEEEERRPLQDDGGGVRLLDVMQARGLTFERTVLLGWHADALPQGRAEDVVLPDALREALRERTGRPIPLRAAAQDEERLLAVALLGSARAGLEIVRQRADASGRTRSPSPYLREVARLALGRPDLHALLGTSVPLHAGPVGWLRDLADRTGSLSEDEAMLRAALAASSAEALLRTLPGDHVLTSGLRLLAATERFTPGEDSGRYDGRTGKPYGGGRLSASALESLGRCPQQFFFGKVLRVRGLEDEPDLDGLAGNVLGLAVHALLERLYAGLRDRGLLAPGNDAAALAEVDAVLPTLWEEVTAPVAARRARRLPGLWAGITARWLAALRAFVRDDLARLRAEEAGPLTLESMVEADVPLQGGRVLAVRGRLDRVVRGRHGVRIGDYKTGAGNLHGRIEPKAMVTGDALQAPLYARIVGADAVELLGVGPVMARRDPKDARVVLESLGPLDAGFVETLGVLHDLLQAGVYPLHKGMHCSWCDFQRACRRTHPPTAAREALRPDSLDFRDVKRKTGQQKTTLAEVRAARPRADEVPA